MTTKQKQCLLEYLGYYSPENSGKVNNIDGELGPKTRAATEKFQTDYALEADGIFGPDTEKRMLEVIATGEKPGVDWSKVKYFRKEEFMCNCGGKHCGGFPAEPVPMLLKVADNVRGHFNKAALVSSGVRCKQHNKNVGGVANSRHLTGRAMDFRISGKSAAQVLEYVWTLPEVRYAYDIDGTYVHMDVK